MNKVKRAYFLDKEAEYYQDEKGELWMTAKQIGELLGYKRPRHSVLTYYHRHRNELIDDTRRVKLDTGNGKHETTIFNVDAIIIIGCKGNSKARDEFILWFAERMTTFEDELKITLPLIFEYERQRRFNGGDKFLIYPTIKFFKDTKIEIILDDQKNFWFYAEQIGKAIGVDNPLEYINEIFDDYKNRLDGFVNHRSNVILETPEGPREKIIISERAVLFMMNASSLEFFDFFFDIIDTKKTDRWVPDLKLKDYKVNASMEC